MLDVFLRPRSVAVIGASTNPDKLGYQILDRLIDSGFTGGIYPVNPKADEILGCKSFASVSAIPGEVDLVVIVVPSKFVAQVLEESGEKGSRGAIIITAGFREIGAEGAALESELLKIARRYNMRIVGPNCLGMITTATPVNTSFAMAAPSRGAIAFMSQSGALGAAVLDYAVGANLGLSHFASLGNKADVDEADLLQAWGEDPNTKAIIAYIEGINDGPKFMQAAQETSKDIQACDRGQVRTHRLRFQGRLIAHREPGRLRCCL